MKQLLKALVRKVKAFVHALLEDPDIRVVAKRAWANAKIDVNRDRVLAA